MPQISVNGPSSPPRVGDIVVFKAKIEPVIDFRDSDFTWSISTGRILDGKRGPRIRVRFDVQNEELRARVKIKGLPKHCQNFASETVPFWDPPDNLLINEFSTALLETQQLSIFEEPLRNDKRSQVYVIVALGPNDHFIRMQKQIRDTLNKLSSVGGVETNRIIFLIQKRGDGMTRICQFLREEIRQGATSDRSVDE